MPPTDRPGGLWAISAQVALPKRLRNETEGWARTPGTADVSACPIRAQTPQNGLMEGSADNPGIGPRSRFLSHFPPLGDTPRQSPLVHSQ
jgi:hypothetical protein